MAKCFGSFTIYALVTLGLFAVSVWHAFHTRKQFFPATIFLTTNKINVVVLSNVAFMMTISFAKLVRRIFLGDISAQEITEIERKGKIAVTETCLALTTFREEINIRMVVLFTLLLFVKIFHWLTQMRVENVAVQRMSYGTHIRLSFLTLLLTILDLAFVSSLTLMMIKQKGPSVLLLFAFEFMILSVVIVITAAKYLLFVHSRAGSSAEGGEAPVKCCHKHVWMFYLDFCADLLRLFLLLTFFMIICSYYGLPIHLIREIWVTFYGLRDRILKYIQYRRLLRVLDHFPRATEAELLDTRCTICLESMDEGIKLPCSHVFHKHCLYTWLFNSNRCPNCLREIPTSLPLQNGAAAAAAAAQEPVPAAANIPNHQGQQAQVAGHSPVPETSAASGPGSDGEHVDLKGDSKINRSGTTTTQRVPGSSAASLPYHRVYATPPPGPYYSHHFAFPLNVGGSAFQGSPAGTETMMRVSQRQTLMLQQHVDFLQTQLASTLGMLQQQLSLQAQLMKEQSTQEMATRASPKTSKVKEESKESSHSPEKKTGTASETSFKNGSRDEEKAGSGRDEAKGMTAGKMFGNSSTDESAASKQGSDSVKSDTLAQTPSEMAKLPRPRISRETSTPYEALQARLQKFQTPPKRRSDGESGQES